MLLKDIKYKVWTVVAILLVGIAAIMVINQIADVKHIASLKEVSGNVFTVTQKSQEIVSSFKLQLDNYQGSFLYGDLDLLEESKEYRADIESAFDYILSANTCSSDEISYINQLYDKYVQYSIAAEYVYGMLATNDPEKIKKAESKTASLYNSQVDLSGDFQQLDDRIRQNLRDKINSVNMSIKKSNYILIIFAVAIVFVALLINSVIINLSIFRPVDSMFTKLNLFEKEKDVEVQLLQRHRLESLGDLAGGVAHEINNPVSCVYNNMKVMANYAEMIKDIIAVTKNMLESDPESLMKLQGDLQKIDQEEDMDYVMNDVSRLLEETTKETERISEIVSNLLIFARPDASEATPYNIVDGLKAAVKSLRMEIEGKGKVFEDYQLVPAVVCYPGDINLAFMSILKNAIQAIGQNGTVFVSVREEGANVVVEIKDDGCGISEQEINNVFNLFYTTRSFGQGMGLGLSVAYGIVRSHDGYIKVESTLGEGSMFTIVLPTKSHLSRKLYNKEHSIVENIDV